MGKSKGKNLLARDSQTPLKLEERTVVSTFKINAWRIKRERGLVQPYLLPRITQKRLKFSLKDRRILRTYIVYIHKVSEHLDSYTLSWIFIDDRV